MDANAALSLKHRKQAVVVSPWVSPALGRSKGCQGAGRNLGDFGEVALDGNNTEKAKVIRRQPHHSLGSPLGKGHRAKQCRTKWGGMAGSSIHLLVLGGKAAVQTAHCHSLGEYGYWNCRLILYEFNEERIGV